MTPDDIRHPTGAEMDALEAIIHPEGRCAVCGGGKPYWKHTANDTEYHPFTGSVRAASERLGILPVGPRGQEVVRRLPPEIVHPAPFTEDWSDPAMDAYDVPPSTESRLAAIEDEAREQERARYTALVEAARDLVDLSPLDTDSEGFGGDWCHVCGELAGYSRKGEPFARHAKWCAWAALRAVLEGEPLSPPKPKRKRRPTYIDAEGNRRTDYSEEPR
jgi:hypothetical protein